MRSSDATQEMPALALEEREGPPSIEQKTATAVDEAEAEPVAPPMVVIEAFSKTDEMPAFAQPEAAVAVPTTAPEIVAAVTEDDAYYHPGGRIRSIHEQTNEWPRVDPTLVVQRIREKNQSSWLILGLVALLAPLLFLAVIMIVPRVFPASHPVDARAARMHTPDSTKTPLVASSITSMQTHVSSTPATTAKNAPARRNWRRGR